MIKQSHYNLIFTIWNRTYILKPVIRYRHKIHSDSILTATLNEGNLWSWLTTHNSISFSSYSPSQKKMVVSKTKNKLRKLRWFFLKYFWHSAILLYSQYNPYVLKHFSVFSFRTLYMNTYCMCFTTVIWTQMLHNISNHKYTDIMFRSFFLIIGNGQDTKIGIQCICILPSIANVIFPSNSQSKKQQICKNKHHLNNETYSTASIISRGHIYYICKSMKNLPYYL